MLIANPIYDVVFKYLMEDEKVARLLISAIIGEEILSLGFQSQELSGELEQAKRRRSSKKTKSAISESTNLTVYRLDFSAVIKTDEGEKVVIIEIQKAKLLNDIIRFRRYLGAQYANGNYAYSTRTASGKKIKAGYPIIGIWFLGERLDGFIGIPVIEIARTVRDRRTGEELSGKDVFIEGLTHKGFIVSIPDLPGKRRNELETLLSVFDQSAYTDSTHHLLNVNEEDFPEKFRPLIRRLQKAASEPSVRQKMDMEDDFLSELQTYERELAEERKQKEEERKQKEEERKQKEAFQVLLAESLFAQGLSPAAIAEKTGLTIEQLTQLLKKMNDEQENIRS